MSQVPSDDRPGARGAGSARAAQGAGGAADAAEAGPPAPPRALAAADDRAPPAAPDATLAWQTLLREWLAALQPGARDGASAAPAAGAARVATGVREALEAIAHELADLAQLPPGPCDFSIDCGRLGVVAGRIVVAADGASADIALRARRPETRGLLLLHRERVQRQASERAGVALRLRLR